MGNPKYGEFTFDAPKARPTVAGYAHGGKVAMKKGEESKSVVKSAKLVGMKMEPEGMVKKEVALLKKAGAPAKMIKHEEREGALMGLKKGGKPKGYQEGGSAESDISSENVFREVNGKYMHNNQEVSKGDFDRRKAAADSQIQRMRGPDRSKMPAKDRARSAFSELDAEIEKKPYKKGGMAGYAEGGGAMSDKELAAKEDARADKALRDQQKGYKEHYKREEAENRADRKAAQDALMYIPRKIGQGAKSAYEAVMGKKKGGEVHSDVAMDKKAVKKAVHKHEAAMHPGKPMTKLKKGGQPKKLEIGGYLAAPNAPASPAPMGSSANAPSALAGLSQKYASQAAAARPAMGARPNPNAPGVKPMTGNPALSPRGAVTGGPRPGMVNTNAVRPTTPMKKGGAAKKGVPTFNRTPKC